MEVILLETFDRLGQIGDVVNVKNGFARNYLIPQKKALRANKENKEKFQKIKDELIVKNKKIIEESKSVIKKIEKDEIIFIRNASDNGQLYGSVSPKDISNYFSEKKIDIRPSNINLHSSIKKIGIYDINIKLHAEVSCNLKINVATSDQSAKKQKLELQEQESKTKEKVSDQKGSKDETEKNNKFLDSKANTGKNKENISTTETSSSKKIENINVEEPSEKETSQAQKIDNQNVEPTSS